MRKILGLLMLVLCLLFFAPFVQAADFNVNVEPINDNIYATESALFNLTITNQGAEEETYKISSNVLWDLTSDPLPDYFSGMKVGPNEKDSTLLKFSPPARITGGSKQLNLDIEDGSGEKITIPIAIHIKAIGYGPQGYVPFVMTSLIVEPVKINPQNKFTAKVKLKNGNVLNLSEVSVELTTKKDLFYKKRVVDIDPLEEKTETFVISMNPLTEPTEDTLVAIISYQDTYFKPAQESIEVVPYENLVEEKKADKSFLKTRHTIELINKGNTEFAELYKVETSLFENLFTGTKPDAKMMTEEGERYVVWEIVLEPGQKITLEHTENYRPLFAVLFIAILSIVLYYVFRSDVAVDKSAEVLEVEEGGISKIKLTLNIKNRSRKKLDHIKIIEKIPNIASYVKEDYLGTLKPNKVLRHDVKGTLLKWDIDKLEGYEERMITYKIKSKLSILGTLKLSPAIAKFKNKKGKITITHSNRYSLKMG